MNDGQASLRLIVSVALFVLFAVWEAAGPRRPQSVPRRTRWPHNLALGVLDPLLVRIIFPGTAVGVALVAADHGWGLLQPLQTGSPLAAGIAGFLLLDLTIYGQHMLFHKVPWLWRLHRVHHTDTEIDVSTGVRFHPLEIILSLLIKGAAIMAGGVSAGVVLSFEIVLNATSLFNHSNLAIAPGLDRRLRWLLVTPDMHRVHHSTQRAETDSNFGFNIPWWDRLFGTYRDQPVASHLAMAIGLGIFRSDGDQRLDQLLLQPWRRPAVSTHRAIPYNAASPPTDPHDQL